VAKISNKPVLEPASFSLYTRGGFVYFKVFHRDSSQALAIPMTPQTARDLAASLYDYAEAADRARTEGKCLLHRWPLIQGECARCNKEP
jgi:hypothetical protein